MNEVTLTAEVGRPKGSRPSKRLRAEGKVPGVVYGHGGDPIAVAVDWRELRHALTTDAGLNALIDLQVGGETRLTMVKELQRHPVRHEVLHVDFLEVSRDIAVDVEVPIVLEGEATNVLNEDGIVEQSLHALAIKAKPGAIPNELVVDISDLEIGASIRVGDLRLPNGVTTEVDPEEPVVTGQITRAAIEAEAETEAEEAAEAVAEELGGEGEGEATGGGESAEDGADTAEG
jgi:large subunit ribosomal protein L25